MKDVAPSRVNESTHRARCGHIVTIGSFFSELDGADFLR